MNLDANVNNQIFRRDWPQVIARNRQLAKISPVRLAYDPLGYTAGQAIARLQSDGFWHKWSAVSGSSCDSQMILMDSVDPQDNTDAASGTAVSRGLVSADVYQAQLLDFNSTFQTALGGRTIVVGSDNIWSF